MISAFRDLSVEPREENQGEEDSPSEREEPEETEIDEDQPQGDEDQEGDLQEDDEEQGDEKSKLVELTQELKVLAPQDLKVGATQKLKEVFFFFYINLQFLIS